MFNEDFKLHQDEKLIVIVRRHWLFLLLDILEVFALFIIPTIFIWIAQYYSLVPLFSIFGITFNSLLNILVFMWAILCWLYLAEKVTDFAIDFWIVTNKRIVDSNLEKLFQRSLSTLELKDIEDITIKTSGFFSSYLAFGSLEVQTAGAANRFEMNQIAKPELVQRILFDAKVAEAKEEKDIEKGEIEQISKRVMKDFQIPTDQIVSDSPSKNQNYDWGHVADKRDGELEIVDEKIAEIEDKYKSNIKDALRIE